MRLGDFEQLKEEILWGNVYLFEKETNELVDAVDNQPTIDPETLPIVQELMEKLERVIRERDAAIKKLREIEWCNGCKNFIGLKGCSIGELVTCNPQNDMYVFGYKE